MAEVTYQEVDSFVSDLVSRCEAFARNQVWDEKEKLQETVDELCALYIRLTGEERDHVRAIVRPHRSLRDALFNHVGWAGRRIKGPEDREWLRRGLAAASIEDNRTDYRDTFIALGEIYLAAGQVGIDVSGCFREAAEWSSTEPDPWLKCSMRKFLSEFEKSEYFKRSVSPRLSGK